MRMMTPLAMFEAYELYVDNGYPADRQQFLDAYIGEWSDWESFVKEQQNDTPPASAPEQVWAHHKYWTQPEALASEYTALTSSSGTVYIIHAH